MIADKLYLVGENNRLIATSATGAFIIGQVKYLIHTGMESIGLKYFHDLIYQVEYNFMHTG